MKRLLRSILVVSLLACAAPAWAENQEVVRASAAATIYPRGFDGYAAGLASDQRRAYLECLPSVQRNLANWFRRSTSHCEGIEPQYRQGCYDNDATKVGIMLDCITATVRDGHPFSSSICGTGLLMSEQILGPSFQELQKRVVYSISSALTCP